jgi:long-chain acyl-CoA synthetase
MLATSAEILRHWAAHKPHHLALCSGDSQLTFAELDARTNRVAQALSSAGIGPQEPVAFLDKNRPELIELFFGAAKLNAIPSPINFRLGPAEVAGLLADSAAKVLVVGAEFLPAVDLVRKELQTQIVVIDDPGSAQSYASWRDAQPAEDPNVAQSGNDVAYLLYSSGTTGTPKGVQLTQANLMWAMASITALLHLDGNAVSLAAMPLYHIGGGGWALAGFFAGATTVLVREVVPDQVVELIDRTRISHAFLVPAVLQSMLDVSGVQQRDLSSLRYIVYGAAPISERVLAAAIRVLGCRFVQVYGLTESTGGAMYLPETDHDLHNSRAHRLRAIGVPLTGVAARVVDPITGRDASTGETGEIWLRGPGIMQGYLDMPEATAEATRPGGWLRTGDAGYRDADGYYYLQDRIKDMIVSGGENIYPAEIENVLMSHPGVAEVAVIGVPHCKWGETPLAIVVRASGQHHSEAELLAHCRAHLATYKCPTAVTWNDELPRNPSGKVLKNLLREPYWIGHERYIS